VTTASISSMSSSSASLTVTVPGSTVTVASVMVLRGSACLGFEELHDLAGDLLGGVLL
jgi:hypothetical protein